MFNFFPKTGAAASPDHGGVRKNFQIPGDTEDLTPAQATPTKARPMHVWFNDSVVNINERNCHKK